MEAWAQSQKLSELRVDVERKGGDSRALAAALEELSLDVGQNPRRHVDLLLEAAKAHEVAGDYADALAAAERAAALEPSAPEPQILARHLEYRVRGPASREHARLTVAALRGLHGPLTLEQAELRGFLVAEALDRAVGAGAGMRELSKLDSELGARPLIALGIAERLAEAGEYTRALPLFDVALAGDLRACRVRGRVAITAADAARQAGDFIRALSYVEQAAADATTRDAALVLQTQLRAEQRAIESALERVPDAPVAPPPPPVRRHTPAATPMPAMPAVEPSPEPPRYVTPKTGTPIVTAAPHTATPAMGTVSLTRLRNDPPALPIVTAPSAEESPSRRALDEDLPGPRESNPQLPVVDPVPFVPTPPPPAPAERRPSAIPSAERPALEHTTYSQSAPADHISAPTARRPSSRPPPPAVPAQHVEISHKGDFTPPTGLDRFSMRPAVEVMPPSLRRMSGSFPATSSMEVELFEQLGSGSAIAGMELIRQLENRRDRAHDLVAVCRHMVALSPGNRENLRRLYDATLADKNHTYARSVEHVLALFDPSVDAVAPPPLGDLPEDPERVRAIVFRDVHGPAAEALALTWEGASHVFRREPSTYGVTGMERVPLNAPTPLGRTYGAAARVLGLGRTPLFQRRTGGPISLGVGLLNPPAVIVSGDQPRETPELIYHLGAMLTATLPEHVLVFGSTEDQARSILSALLIAFGPPGAGRGALASVGNLAEVLWERVPARNQRRLRELCEDRDGFEFVDVAAAEKARALLGWVHRAAPIGER
jgi:tetratricopeptide (TPR) repeat protein